MAGSAALTRLWGSFACQLFSEWLTACLKGSKQVMCHQDNMHGTLYQLNEGQSIAV